MFPKRFVLFADSSIQCLDCDVWTSTNLPGGLAAFHNSCRDVSLFILALVVNFIYVSYGLEKIWVPAQPTLGMMPALVTQG